MEKKLSVVDLRNILCLSLWKMIFLEVYDDVPKLCNILFRDAVINFLYELLFMYHQGASHSFICGTQLCTVEIQPNLGNINLLSLAYHSDSFMKNDMTIKP